MADTGYNWGAWAFVKDDAGTDWDADLLADNAAEISNTAISLDNVAACEVGIALYENNTGAINGVVTIFVLGSGGGIADEEYTIGSPYSFTITPVTNDTVYKRFSVDPGSFGSFKPAVFNESGQELAVSVKVRTATIPVAS